MDMIDFGNIHYPKHLYADIRSEEINSTRIIYNQDKLDTLQMRKNQGIYIRAYDGKRWYTHSSSDQTSIDDKLKELSLLATPNPQILNHPRIKNTTTSVESILMGESEKLIHQSIEEKKVVLHQFDDLLKKEPLLADWSLVYSDYYLKKKISNSLGSTVVYDKQLAGIAVVLQMKKDGRYFREFYQKAGLSLSELYHLRDDFEILLEKAKRSLMDGKHVDPGSYCVILSPFTAGVFAHESFGHKSEADFMTMSDSPEMLNEWPIGKQVGDPSLSIIDDGSVIGGGFTPYDDEGTKGGPTHLIKNGILSGRLHSIESALELDEKPTGNARAINYEYDPLVRMTTTYIESGNLTKEKLFESVEHGYYIETLKHGSGMTRFTIAPSLSYEIIDGKIGKPVEIAVLSGNVMETLYKISGLSDKKELFSFAVGGCGKFEQQGLPVAFGGPYVRIDEMEIQ